MNAFYWNLMQQLKLSAHALYKVFLLWRQIFLQCVCVCVCVTRQNSWTVWQETVNLTFLFLFFLNQLQLLLSWCLMSSDVIWHIRDKLWPMPKHGSIRKVHACLAVTCHLHFWQNDRDFLRATVVTRGWNGYRNRSQHRKSTLEKKIRTRDLSITSSAL